MSTTKNIPASVHARLLNISKATGRPFNELLQYYGMERFLFRLSKSDHRDDFVLKGALMLRSLGTALTRPTMDIDLLGRIPNEHKALTTAIRECMSVPVADGITYDHDSLTTEDIVQDADYHGIRVKFTGHLGSARLNFQVDVGFGDMVTPRPTWVDFPDLLNFGTPHLLAYPATTAVAEKLQIMVDRDAANSRMKDFYDVDMMSKQLTFNGATLLKAIRVTFETRHCEITKSAPLALTQEFASSSEKQTQWHAFLRKLRIDNAAPFENVIGDLANFLLPILDAAANDRPFYQTWAPGGPWT
jgi:hypothetical protein